MPRRTPVARRVRFTLIQLELDRIEARRILVTRLPSQRIHQRALIPVHVSFARSAIAFGIGFCEPKGFITTTGLWLACAYSSWNVSKSWFLSYSPVSAITTSTGAICWRRFSRRDLPVPARGGWSGVL